MAIIDASTALGGVGGHTNLPYMAILDGYDPATYQDYGEYVGFTTLSSTTAYVMAAADSRAINSAMASYYADDYYNRIHVTPSKINVGNLLSSQEREVLVWNAFLIPKTLLSIEGYNNEGVILTQPIPAPTVYNGLEERDYTITIERDGPPVIDASYRFSFSGESLITLPVIGQRVVIFPFLPMSGVDERLQWRTDIIKTRKGEQRMAMIPAPRQTLNLRIPLDAAKYSLLKNMALTWSYRVWAVPVWHEATYNQTIDAGATEILFSTADADYRSGGVAIIYRDHTHYEAVNIISVLSDRIILERPVISSYTGAAVTPGRVARMPEGVNIKRTGAGNQEAIAAFAIIDNIDLSAQAQIYQTYKGYPVVTDKCFILSGSLNERINRPTVEIDNGQGVVIVETKQDYSDFAQSLDVIAFCRSDIWKMRTWLHSLYGRQKAFFIPSFNHDIVPIESIGDAQTQIKIETVNLDLYRDFAQSFIFFFNDGTSTHRDVINSQIIDGVETITISAGLGASVSSGIQMVSRLSLVRLNADTVTIKHDSQSHAKIKVPVMEVQA